MCIYNAYIYDAYIYTMRAYNGRDMRVLSCEKYAVSEQWPLAIESTDTIEPDDVTRNFVISRTPHLV